MNRIWQVNPGGLDCISEYDHLEDFVLRQRGVGMEHRRQYFEPRYKEAILDPTSLVGVKEAVDRIYQARKNKERVLVYGDYDVDGLSSTALVVSLLRDMEIDVIPLVPHRSDNGYGLHLALIKDLAEHVDLVITVDCGVSNLKEVEWLGENGVDVIITDHHKLPEKIPKALCVVHPAHPSGSYQCPHLCGAGVAWKLTVAVLRDERCPLDDAYQREIDGLDLACLGTIADVVPLQGENRAIVKFGLKMITQSRRPGLQVLSRMSKRGDMLTAKEVAFRMAPLLNAAGRIDHAQPALDFLLTDDEDEAKKKLLQLQSFNKLRRTLGEKILTEAEAQYKEEEDIVFVSDNKWLAGVVGLVAGRLSEKYNKPAFVVGGAAGRAVGSVRAPAGVDVIDMIKKAGGILTEYGGHEKAAGFSLRVEDIGRLRERIQSLAVSKKRGYFLAAAVEEADAIIKEGLINWDLAELTEKMAPFGEGNKEPAFIVKAITLGHWRAVGSGGEHAKFSFRSGDEIIDGIGFGLTQALKEEKISNQSLADVLFKVEINEYRGRRNVQMKVLDISRPGGVGIKEADAVLTKSAVR